MSQFFRVEQDRSYSGVIDAAHRWGLPGVRCPGCGATWSGGCKMYPSVDLTPIASLADFETPRPEPLEEYERLRELVRPLLPAGAVVEPGASFGPLRGTARGRLGGLVCPYSWWLMARREALEGLQAEGLRGLKGCAHQLRFRQAHAPELLDLELLPVGRLHEDCLPAGHPPPCERCGRRGLSLPATRLLDKASLPEHLDVFRLEDFSSLVICTERFVEACRRRALDGLSFTPLPAR